MLEMFEDNKGGSNQTS